MISVRRSYDAYARPFDGSRANHCPLDDGVVCESDRLCRMQSIFVLLKGELW
jgi:hypothetical protein